MARVDVLLDLVHQDHRVAHDHARQGDGAQHGHEAERHAEHQQREGHADQAQRRGQQHQRGAREAAQLQHQQGDHGQQEQRHAGLDRVLPARRIFHRTAGFQQITLRQVGTDFFQCGQDLPDHGGRGDAIADVGTHGHGGQAVAMPDDAVLEGGFDAGDLRQRHAAVLGGHGQAAEHIHAFALISRATQQDLDQLVAFAIGADPQPGQRAGEEVRHVGGAHAHGTGAILVDLQAQHLAGFVPVQVDVGHIGIGTHLRGNLLGQRLHAVDVFTGNTHLDGIAHRRAVFQAGHAELQLRELRADFVEQPGAHGFTRLDVFGQHHELGEVGLRQLLVQRQVETWRTGAHVGHVVVHAFALGQDFLQALGLRFGGTQRTAFGQFHVDHQFRPHRIREELLRHETEQRNRQHEGDEGDADHQPAMAQAGIQQFAVTLVERRGIGIGVMRGVRLGRQPAIECGVTIRRTLTHATPARGQRAGLGWLRMMQVRQHLVAEIRNEQHRRDPRHHQRNGHHLEQRARVFTRTGCRSGDGQEAGGRDQRAGEHGEGGGFIGEAGRAHAVEALLHLDGHHLHRDDRVVHQQAQCQHQRTQ